MENSFVAGKSKLKRGKRTVPSGPTWSSIESITSLGSGLTPWDKRYLKVLAMEL